MRRSILYLPIGLLVGVCLCPEAFAQTALTWQQVKAKFEADNPNLRAGQLNIQESKAQEVTAYLRPNPNLTGGFGSVRSLHRQSLSAVCLHVSSRRLRLSA